jgi:hypothetical protein
VNIVFLCSLAAILVAACNSTRTFAQLVADASAVPVPPGVTFVRQQQSLNDGPGFTTSKFEEVTREYSCNVPCESLKQSWADVLRVAKRPFQISSIGSLEIITITDRPEHLGITIGDGPNHCRSPFVWAFNSPH